MPRRTPWEDEYTLLCERCGYVVEGLDPAGNCPECGKPIAESLPERRVGTAWQRLGSFWSFLCTLIAAVMRPKQTLSQLRVEQDRSRAFRRHAIRLAALLTTFIVLTWLGTIEWPTGGTQTVQASILTAAAVAAVATPLAMWLLVVVLHLLTQVEQRGLVFIAARRGFRLDGACSYAVCSAGCAAWAMGAIAGFLVSIPWFVVYLSAELNEDWAVTELTRVDGIATFALPILAGFLYFEVFAWLGLRRCKFANRARPGADASCSFKNARAARTEEPGA